jgi:hypothetical protein
MKLFAIALAVSGVASAASLGAQTTLPSRAGGVVVPTTSTSDCRYTRTTNSVGDIVFGRTNLVTDCRDVYSRNDGAWYQVGRGHDNNSVYERRVRDRNGNLVIQRARRNPNGSFTILSSRVANSNDKEWRKEQKAQEKAYKKEQKAEEKAYDKEHKAEEKAEKNYNKKHG